MPGSVKTISTTGLDTFPVERFTSYQVSHTWHTVTSEYPDGSCQRYSPVTTDLKRWRVSAKLTLAQLDDLKTFYSEHIGLPFLFGDVHDEAAYKAVITSPLQITHSYPRWEVSLEIEEIF